MFCPNCGTKNEGSELYYCKNCGGQLPSESQKIKTKQDEVINLNTIEVKKSNSPSQELTSRSWKALVSIILGISSHLGASVFAGIPAIIFGLWALFDIKRYPELLTGRRFSISGIVLGIISCIIFLIAVLFFDLPVNWGVLNK